MDSSEKSGRNRIGGSVTDSPNMAQSNPIPESLLKLSRWYTNTAVTVFSTLILFLGFVFLSYAYYTLPGKGVLPVYSKDFQPRAMHRMDRDQALKFFNQFD